MRFARDPQQMYNYNVSAATESIAQAPKSPYLVTAEMVKPYKAIWNTANTSNRPYLPYKPDPKSPGAMPQRLPAAEPPVALWEAARQAAEDMQATIGIYDAGLGQRSNETSGRAINARQRESDTANFHYADNLAHSLTHAGRILVDLIPKIYDTQRTIRIMGEDDAEDFVEINQVTHAEDGEPILLNDLSHGRFDVRVSVGPSYATKRIESAESMMAFAQANPQAAPLIADLIAKNSDWPGADKMAELAQAHVATADLAERNRRRRRAAAGTLAARTGGATDGIPGASTGVRGPPTRQQEERGGNRQNICGYAGR